MTNLFYPKNAARLAIQAGAAGIIVSNHGARQLDYVPATISALEEVFLYLLTSHLLFFLPYDINTTMIN